MSSGDPRPIWKARSATFATAVDDVRRIARELRPEASPRALDTLGLVAAMTNLCERLSQRTGIAIVRRLERDLPAISDEDEVVIYRIAQESLTNAVRHASPKAIEIALRRDADGIELTVGDDGVGYVAGRLSQGGVLGMRERALSIGAQLRIDARPGAAGTLVTLRLPGAPMTRVLLADDHALVRHGLRMILDAEPDFEVVAEASDGQEAVAMGLRDQIELALLDVAMPRLTGIQAARELTEQRPDLRVLIVSMHDNEQFVFEALRAGASGYILKSAAHHDLIRACRQRCAASRSCTPAELPRSGATFSSGVGASCRTIRCRFASRRFSSSSPRASPAARSRACCRSATRPSSATAAHPREARAA